MKNTTQSATSVYKVALSPYMVITCITLNIFIPLNNTTVLIIFIKLKKLKAQQAALLYACTGYNRFNGSCYKHNASSDPYQSGNKTNWYSLCSTWFSSCIFFHHDFYSTCMSDHQPLDISRLSYYVQKLWIQSKLSKAYSHCYSCNPGHSSFTAIFSLALRTNRFLLWSLSAILGPHTRRQWRGRNDTGIAVRICSPLCDWGNTERSHHKHC